MLVADDFTWKELVGFFTLCAASGVRCPGRRQRRHSFMGRLRASTQVLQLGHFPTTSRVVCQVDTGSRRLRSRAHDCIRKRLGPFSVRCGSARVRAPVTRATTQIHGTSSSRFGAQGPILCLFHHGISCGRDHSQQALLLFNRSLVHCDLATSRRTGQRTCAQARV